MQKKLLLPAGYTLGAGGLPWADALAETTELIGVQRIPSGFVSRIMLELAMLQHIAGCWVKDWQGQRVVLVQKGRAKSSKVSCSRWHHVIHGAEAHKTHFYGRRERGFGYRDAVIDALMIRLPWSKESKGSRRTRSDAVGYRLLYWENRSCRR